MASLLRLVLFTLQEDGEMTHRRLTFLASFVLVLGLVGLSRPVSAFGAPISGDADEVCAPNYYLYWPDPSVLEYDCWAENQGCGSCNDCVPDGYDGYFANDCYCGNS